MHVFAVTLGNAFEALHEPSKTHWYVCLSAQRQTPVCPLFSLVRWRRCRYTQICRGCYCVCMLPPHMPPPYVSVLIFRQLLAVGLMSFTFLLFPGSWPSWFCFPCQWVPPVFGNLFALNMLRFSLLDLTFCGVFVLLILSSLFSFRLLFRSFAFYQQFSLPSFCSTCVTCSIYRRHVSHTHTHIHAHNNACKRTCSHFRVQSLQLFCWFVWLYAHYAPLCMLYKFRLCCLWHIYWLRRHYFMLHICIAAHRVDFVFHHVASQSKRCIYMLWTEFVCLN